eukprot:2310220-Rhodomonas_salina.1
MQGRRPSGWRGLQILSCRWHLRKWSLRAAACRLLVCKCCAYANTSAGARRPGWRPALAAAVQNFGPAQQEVSPGAAQAAAALDFVPKSIPVWLCLRLVAAASSSARVVGASPSRQEDTSRANCSRRHCSNPLILGVTVARVAAATPIGATVTLCSCSGPAAPAHLSCPWQQVGNPPQGSQLLINIGPAT